GGEEGSWAAVIGNVGKGKAGNQAETANLTRKRRAGGAPHSRLSSLIDERAAQIFSPIVKKSRRTHFARKTVKNRPRRSSHQ
ncbi:hypothetical protein, partial [Burkholderia cenocepacia]